MENKKRFITRTRTIRERLPQLQTDGILVCKNENKKYLSGFHSTSYYVVLTPQEGFLLTDARYIESAQTNLAELTPVLLDKDYTVFDFLANAGISKLALETDFITHRFYQQLKECLPMLQLCSAEGFIETLRMVKDKDEIEALRNAESIGDAAFNHLLGYIKAGVSEWDLALELEFQMKRLGASALSFETICASGPRSSLPHGTATDRKLKAGDFITFDFGCVYRDYCSDMTRTVALSRVTAEMEKVYGIVLEAQRATVDAVCSGKTCVEIDSVARDIIKYHGYGDYFGHGLGHGVGLEIHEAPTLGPRGTGVIEENMAVTVEPGIYLPGKFGVRIEDLVIVKKDGCENLSSSDKELIIVS